MTSSPFRLPLWYFFLFGLLSIALCPWLGSAHLTWNGLFEKNSLTFIVFWKIRFPRVLLSFCAGSALSLGGLVFQTLFSNVLATPFTLGVASGASLGVCLSAFIGWGIFGSFFFGFSGALCSILIVWLLAKTPKGRQTNHILLAGVALSFFFSSAILLFEYLGNMQDVYSLMHWLMGDLSNASPQRVLLLSSCLLLAVSLIGMQTSQLDLLCLDDDLAKSYGLDTLQLSHRLFLITSLLLAAVVSCCGPIGFVGMMAPHICRLLVGNRHRALLPASLLTGGSFLTICDSLARSLGNGVEIPVGIITTLLGCPFFLFLLLNRMKNS